MAKVNFQWIMSASIFDSTNYTHPRSVLANADDIYYINPALRQMYTAKFKENIVWDSKGLFDPDRKQRTRYYDISNVFVNNAYRDINKLQCTPEEVVDDNSDCSSYFEFTFQSSGVVFNYKRSYKTLGDTLGDIGGLNGVIILVFMVLSKPIIEWSYNRHILHKVYSFLEDDAANKIFTEDSREKVEPVSKSKGLFSSSKKKAASSIISKIACCCRKKADASSARLKEEALDLMEANFDIINIIRDLNTIKVLADIFLKERHLRLAQMVRYKVSHDANSANKKENQTPRCCPLTCKASPKKKPREHEFIEELKSVDKNDQISQERVQNLKIFFQTLSDNYFKEAIFGAKKEEDCLAPCLSIAEEFDDIHNRQIPSHRPEPNNHLPQISDPQEPIAVSENGIHILSGKSEKGEEGNLNINASTFHKNI
jgi:hypothetical protein